MAETYKLGHLPEINYERTRRTFYVPSLNEMTPQQKVFADEYLIDLHSTQAAIRAGYPPAKASTAANAVMKHPPVRDYIARAMAARSVRVGLTADRVLQRLGAIVMGDPRAIFNEAGGLKRPSDMGPDDALMLAGVKTRRTMVMNAEGKLEPEEITEIKVVDTLAAIALAMKHLGMMNDKLDINVTHSLADRLTAAHSRLMKSRGQVIEATVDQDFGEDAAKALMQLELESKHMHSDIVQEARYEVIAEPPDDEVFW